MRELTKAERHEVYKKALEFLTLDTREYICNCISLSTNEDCSDPDYGGFIELKNKKPINAYYSWFRVDAPSVNKQKRIAILTACINETAP